MHVGLRVSLFVVLSAVCVGCVQTPPSDAMRVTRVAVTDRPIEQGKPPPEFRDYFPSGVENLYVYAWVDGVQGSSETVPVQMSWHTPSDIVPPIARTTIELQPPQFLAQFELRVPNGGIRKSANMVVIRVNDDPTIEGAARFYVGMSPDEVQALHVQEEAFRAQRTDDTSVVETEEKVLVDTEE